LVIDDCSTDGTADVIKKIIKIDGRIKFFTTKKNFGNDAQPKNIGIKNAVGEYVAFLDDDDAYFRDTLKILYKYVSHTKADMVYGDYIMENKKGNRSAGWSMNFSLQYLNEFNYITTGSGMVKREKLIAVGGFNENVPRFKDWNLWLRLAKNGCSIIHVPIPVLLIYALREDSISKKYEKETEYDENGRYKPTFFNPADCKIYADKTVLGERKPLKVAIYTMTLDRLDLTKKMYKSLLDTAEYPFDWFVLDQGSKDDTPEYLKGKCNLIEKKENIGIAKGWDLLIDEIKKKGGYDIVIKVDNDALMMTDGWLDKMAGIFRRNKQLILSPYVEGLNDSPGGVIRSRQDGKSPYILINDKVMGMVPNLGGIVFASPIELFDGFKFPNGIEGNKDYYLSQYAKQQGYSLLYMEELRVFHMGGDRQTKDYI